MTINELTLMFWLVGVPIFTSPLWLGLILETLSNRKEESDE